MLQAKGLVLLQRALVFGDEVVEGLFEPPRALIDFQERQCLFALTVQSQTGKREEDKQECRVVWKDSKD